MTRLFKSQASNWLNLNLLIIEFRANGHSGEFQDRKYSRDIIWGKATSGEENVGIISEHGNLSRGEALYREALYIGSEAHAKRFDAKVV